MALFLIMAGLLAPQASFGAGCHSVCAANQPPDCLGCGFTAFRNVACFRVGCNFCEEDYCTVGIATEVERLAKSPDVDLKAQKVRVVQVEKLSPRS
jgi:hypothetical protein